MAINRRLGDPFAYGWWRCDICGERQLIHKSNKGKRCILTPRCRGKLTVQEGEPNVRAD